MASAEVSTQSPSLATQFKQIRNKDALKGGFELRPRKDTIPKGWSGAYDSQGAQWNQAATSYEDGDGKLEKIRQDIRDGHVEDRLPDPSAMVKAAKCELVDAHKNIVTFESLYTPQDDVKGQRHLFIFVRHFFCGLCQDYIREVTRRLPPSSLPSNHQITIVGCGNADLVTTYAAETDCPYPLYADPSRRLYDMFTFSKNLSMGDKRPDYQTRNFFPMSANSMKQIFSNGIKGFQGGPYNQLGGEMLFVDGEVRWCHRMRNTRDHTEVEVLEQKLVR